MNNTKYAFSNGIGPLPCRGDGGNIGAKMYTYLHLNKNLNIATVSVYIIMCVL